MAVMMPAPREVIFVYNVDLTLFALVSDFVHRLRSPETYPCRLCDLTYDRFTMKREWQQFIHSLPIRARFEPRDRFRQKFPSYSKVRLPAVFEVEADGRLRTLVSAAQLQHAATLADLKTLIAAAIGAAAA
jgi:hypothetical protein